MPTKTINQAFAAAWESVNNPPLDSVNPHFKNKFASLGATIKAVREACRANGITYNQAFSLREEVQALRSWVSDAEGNRIDLSCMYFPQIDNPQQMGSHMTYMRRYLMQLDWGIVGEEDDDAERAMPEKPKDELAELWRECIQLGVKPEGLKSWYESKPFKGKKLDKLTAAERKQVETYLLDMRESIKQVTKER